MIVTGLYFFISVLMVDPGLLKDRVEIQVFRTERTMFATPDLPLVCEYVRERSPRVNNRSEQSPLPPKKWPQPDGMLVSRLNPLGRLGFYTPHPFPQVFFGVV